jgi:hypothetical protein
MSTEMPPISTGYGFDGGMPGTAFISAGLHRIPGNVERRCADRIEYFSQFLRRFFARGEIRTREDLLFSAARMNIGRIASAEWAERYP